MKTVDEVKTLLTKLLELAEREEAGSSNRISFINGQKSAYKQILTALEKE